MTQQDVDRIIIRIYTSNHRLINLRWYFLDLDYDYVKNEIELLHYIFVYGKF